MRKLNQRLLTMFTCRWGMNGPYLHFTKVTFGDKVKHYRNRCVRPWLARHGFGKRTR